MSVLQIAAACLLVACLAYTLRTVGARGAATVSLVGGLFLLTLTLPRLAEPIAALAEMAERADLSAEVSVLMRILFVGLLGSVAAGACRDVGEGGVADRLEMLVRAEILLLSLPFLLEVFSLACEVIG